MRKSLYEQFPHIVADEITLRKIVDSDLDNIFEIYSNEKLFQYTPIMLKKNKSTVANMIGHFERDFHKRKCIFLGICLNSEPNNIVGIAEMFDYSNDVNMITIGYRLNHRFWSKGIATKTVKAMTDYLFNDIGINRIQAFVMPENIKSQNVLQKNGFNKEGIIRQGYVWKGQGVVDLILYSLLKADIEK
ncbi:ribosomal-protein-alanine N-acetyltransferase [Clostridium tetanomorphum]|uniref:GNAT family N-acetyltransferase n=1 Tax=Clostridium tetanomorphum TaxID=1553 RepID=A0A923E9A8_CLOTT|nr:GNAT family protein [Clostridium tetanomorphum]KAJ50194.1 acetyltransferase family protein [Clostridium tetanomorphum DSM 665]MBC2396245.1 GNAT family N-acetyltransferase [Clostridium tetanomorphum]MBP1864331.1 ribosomal-protein-alanine N-acetyltransferase [Clostridium tetanomorphum]NRS83777.1 ribosomal-protein-alanine N-acetyltransferase [Clostridium tetanomorphum]NRZ96968.1 ribosomal-protein-alanine N-acetyltransferase [Clostridium tetanomorphum]